MDDDELIASLAGGDDTALRQLFDRHAPWLAARPRKALPPDEVEDVLQETFLAVWQNAGTYQPRGTPLPYRSTCSPARRARSRVRRLRRGHSRGRAPPRSPLPQPGSSRCRPLPGTPG